MRFVVNNQATIISGDCVTLCVPLTLDGRKFIPGENYDLSATFKETEATVDAACAFQKTTGAGIEHSLDKAYLDIVYLDTQPYKDLMLYGGVVAQHVTTGRRHTVAQFKLYVEYDPQFELDASIAINTSQPLTLEERILLLLMGAEADPTKIGAEYLPATLTGLTGGGADNLDGVATAGVEVGMTRAVILNRKVRNYVLFAGTLLAEASPSLIIPDDYHASTNAKFWVSQSDENIITSPEDFDTIVASRFVSEFHYLTPELSLNDLSFSLPGSAFSKDGQTVIMECSEVCDVFAVTVGVGATLAGMPLTTTIANTAYGWRYFSATATWLRIA